MSMRMASIEGGDAALKRGALLLAGRQITDGNVHQVRKAEPGKPVVCGTVDPLPEGERLAQRQCHIERVAFVDQADPANAVNAPAKRAQQSRQNAQQARFADSVRSGDMQRLAGGERKGQAGKQHALAASAGKVHGGDTALLHGRDR